ncbi:MAG: DUF3368 domain-containing protein [Okeania sp. SIO3B5]|uniref:DUF3368 domain-containing protein n=1 Tax=Okeania sp. SIO3B5 TaxID=2607811 RepID=UPI0013FECF43|nr:DUF3368 domain-containing protein [Okeania sp. SIO3B5]NEO53738.1 DUF3368 domain-containing protein [Okeania sp. SIO3B5]
MIVVSDTSPICYLLLIKQIQLLPQLYGKVLIPRIVQQELSHERSPIVVKNWIKTPPKWLIIKEVTVPVDKDLEVLNAGEKAAMILAIQQEANLIIIDEALGRKVARSKGLKVTGLLGILDRAAQQNLVDFSQAIAALEKTTFRASSKLIKSLLSQY